MKYFTDEEMNAMSQEEKEWHAINAKEWVEQSHAWYSHYCRATELSEEYRDAMDYWSDKYRKAREDFSEWAKYLPNSDEPF